MQQDTKTCEAQAYAQDLQAQDSHQSMTIVFELGPLACRHGIQQRQ